MPGQIEASVADERLRALYRYWNGKRGGRAMPARADIDPVEIPELLPIVTLKDIVEETGRFRYRLAGTEVTDRVGSNLAGHHVDEAHADSRYVDYLTELCREVTRALRPLYAESDHLDGFGGTRRERRLFLPLSDDGWAANMILGGQTSVVTDQPQSPSPTGKPSYIGETLRMLLG